MAAKKAVVAVAPEETSTGGGGESHGHGGLWRRENGIH